MFKIGDKVKCTKKPSNHYYQFKDPDPVGKIYKVIGFGRTENSVILEGETGYFGEGSGLKVVVSKEIKNDVDWLDAI